MKQKIHTILLGLALSATAWAASGSAAETNLKNQADQNIRHALNRLAFGARPGDVERLRQMGLKKWIAAQLSPEKLDDTAVETKIGQLKLLQSSPNQLQMAFVNDTVGFLKKVREMDATKKDGAPQPPIQLTPNQQRMQAELEKANIPQGASSQAVGELSAAKLTRAIESNRQLHEVLVDFWGNHFSVDVKKNAVRAYKIADDRDAIRPFALGKFRDLLGASAKSPAMLVYLDNAQSSRDYDLTNAARQPLNLPPGAAARMKGGLNENYARELMELHTLGVDGGYSQKDVQEVARCLTGWTIDRERGTFRFNPMMHDNGEKIVLGQKFPANGGITDGEMVLDMLARHPSTAKFIAHKLCVRFVADAPPQSLVEKVARSFTASGGDIKSVMQTLVDAPEFWSPEFHRGKIKSPFEFAVSAVRGLGGAVQFPDTATVGGRFQLISDGAASLRDNGPAKGPRMARRTTLSQQVAGMGQPLFAHQTPDGYPENSAEWVSAGALVARLNFALALTGGEVADAPVSPASMLGGINSDDAQAVLNHMLAQLLGGEVGAGTRATLEKELPAPGTPANPAKLCALILGSPEFQRR